MVTLSWTNHLRQVSKLKVIPGLGQSAGCEIKNTGFNKFSYRFLNVIFSALKKSYYLCYINVVQTDSALKALVKSLCGYRLWKLKQPSFTMIITF